MSPADDRSGATPSGDLPETLILVPNSGIQFVEYAFHLDKVPRFQRPFIEREFVNERDAKTGEVPARLLAGWNEDDPDSGEPPASEFGDRLYSLTPVRALEPFLGKWVPVPYIAHLRVDPFGAPPSIATARPTGRACACKRRRASRARRRPTRWCSPSIRRSTTGSAAHLHHAPSSIWGRAGSSARQPLATSTGSCTILPTAAARTMACGCATVEAAVPGVQIRPAARPADSGPTRTRAGSRRWPATSSSSKRSPEAIKPRKIRFSMPRRPRRPSRSISCSTSATAGPGILIERIPNKDRVDLKDPTR